MKSKWKKISVMLMISVTAILTSAMGVGCEQKTNDETPITQELSISQEEISVALYDNYFLSIVNTTGATTIEWTSENAEIVSVENGVVYANAVGSTKIYVTAGDYSDYCTVVVTPLNLAYTEYALQFNTAGLEMYVDDTFMLVGSCYAGKKQVNGKDYTYQSTNESVATVSNDGVIVAKSVGTAEINATAKIADKTVATTVNVTVCNSGKVQITTDSYDLYATTTFEGKTYENTLKLQAEACEKGVKNTNATITWSIKDGADVVSITGNVLTGKKVGSAVVEAAYTGADGVAVTDIRVIKVSPVTAELRNLKIDVALNETEDGYYAVDMQEAIGSEDNLVKAWTGEGVNKKEFAVQNNSVDTSRVTAGVQTWYLQTESVIYPISFNVWTALIDTTEEFLLLKEATGGRYKLTADVDLTGIEWNTNDLPYVFSGLLEGGEHTVTGLTVTGGGLFRKVGNGAAIQNISFKNGCVVANAENAGLLFGEMNSGVGSNATILNVSGNILNRGKSSGGLVGAVSSGNVVTLKNVDLFVYVSATDGYSGVAVGCCNGNFNVIDTTLQSSGTFCGVSTGANNLSANSLNEQYVCASAETVLEEAVDLDLYEGISLTNAPTDADKVIVYANGVFETDYTGGDLNVPESYLENMDGKYLEVVFEKAGEYTYHKVPLYKSGTIKITQENVTDILNGKGNHYYLMENVDLTGITWEPTATFSGTFDGNGYTIKNLSSDTGLFNKLENAEVKNLVLKGSTSGKAVLSASKAGTLTVENAYIEGNAGYLINGGYNAVTLKNVVLNGIKYVFNVGNENGEIICDNCHFVGSSITLGETPDIIANDKKGKISGTDPVKYNSVDDLKKAVQDGTVELTDMLKKALGIE